jgi:hypothetical protein
VHEDPDPSVAPFVSALRQCVVVLLDLMTKSSAGGGV